MTAAKPKSTHKPSGRPSDYDPTYCHMAYKHCLLGATDEQLADLFDVSVVTLNAWKNKHPKFLKALRDGKASADADIAHALYHRARGYSHEAVKIFMPGGETTPVYAPYTEHFPPDTAAASLWLRNRQPTLWRDKTEGLTPGLQVTFTLQNGPTGQTIEGKLAPMQITGLDE